MAYTGRGVGRYDGRSVFVAGGVPGDRLSARVVKSRRKFAEAIVEEILEPSPDRIQAPCVHFDICGGCSFQNIPYEKQLEYKQSFVYDTLKRIGGVEYPPVERIIPCDETFFYRNKMEFSFLPMEDGTVRLGLHVRNRWSEVFDIEDCLLQSRISNQIVKTVREIANEYRIPAYHISGHHGFLRFLVIRDNKSTGDVLLNIVTNEGDFPHQSEMIDRLAADFPEIAVIYRTINATPSNVATGDTEIPLLQRREFFETLGDYKFLVTPTTFLQTNSKQTEILYKQAVSMASLDESHRLLDLYCGCGTIAHFVSPHVKSVLGVELNEAAVKMADINAGQNRVKNVEFRAAEAAWFLARAHEANEYFDRIILDPPRAGIGNKVVRRLGRLKPPVIVYVSCNPSTLARDVEQFYLHGYKLVKTVPVDMFPQTYHVESVSRLELIDEPDV